MALGSSSSPAATLELRFLDAEGGPIGGIGVVVPVRSRANLSGISCGVTDPNGRVTCSGVPVGSWALALSLPPGAGLAQPGRDDLVPAIVVTVAKETDVLRLDLPMVRVEQVEILVEFEGPTPKQPARLHCEEATLGVRRERPLALDRPQLIDLVPGRWQLVITPPQGYITDQVELDGRSIEAPSVTIDVGTAGRLRALRWSFAAPALIEGQLTVHGSAGLPCTPSARLVEPGPLSRRSAARGFTLPDETRAEIRRGPAYQLVLGDGRWFFECAGERIRATTPPAHEVELVAGETRRIDLQVEADPAAAAEDGEYFKVKARALGGRTLGYAAAELRRLDDAPVLVHTSRSSGNGVAVTVMQSSLPSGRYRVSAGSERTGEAEIEVTVEGAGIDESFTLPLGASLRGTVIRPERFGTVPVELLLDRVTPVGRPLLIDPELRRRRDHRRVNFDATGSLEILGLDPGEYRLDARIVDPAVRSLIVTLRDRKTDQPIERGAVLTVNDAETIPIEVRLIEAAQFAARVACLEQQCLPRQIAIATLEEPDPPIEDEHPCPLKPNAGETGSALLSGSAFDRLSAGPFPPGALWIALRPAGFDRWTWLPGSESPSRAARIDLHAGRSTALGDVLIDCAPSLKLTFRSPDGQPPLDLTDLDLTVESRRLPRPDTDDPVGPWRTHPVERTARFARVRNLPTGRFELRLGAQHPYFLPAELVLAPRTLELTLGKEESIEWPLDAIGGAVRYDEPHAALRLSGVDGSVVIGSGTNLLPGTYTVDVCEDDACETVTHTIREVAIGPAYTVRLSTPQR